MKVRNLFFAVLASAAVLVGCQEKDVDYGAPSITVSPSALEFDTAAADLVITLNATRDWRLKDADKLPYWITVNPVSGGASLDAQTITVSVLENKETNREQSLTFTIGLDSKTVTVSQKGEGGETQIETITIQEFITKADTENEYTIKGTVKGLTNASFKGFNLSDGTGEISCAFPANFDDWADKMSDGGVAVVRGKYSFYESKNQHQLYQGTILEFKTLEELPVEDATIAEALTKLGSKVATKGQVIAVSNVSFIINDGGDKNLLVYENKQPSVAVNDVVKVVGVVSEYPGNVNSGVTLTKIAQLSSIVSVEKISDNITAKAQTAKMLTASEAEAYMPTSVELVTITGTVALSGNYINLNIGTDPYGTGSVVSTSFDQTFKDNNGKTLDITGYYAGRNARGYFSILPTAVQASTKPSLSAQAAYSVNADATSVDVAVTSNTSWTATASEGAILDKANGENDGTIKVTFAANEDTENAKVYTVTLKANECEDVVVTITQAKKSGEVGGVVIDVLNLAFTGMSGTTYKDWSGKTATSPAVYAGNSAGDKQSIQLRSKSNAGIITTASGGKVRKVVVTWNEGTSNTGNRQLDIYGKSDAYTATSDLYASDKHGTLLGSIVCGTDTELEIIGDYEFVGMRSKDGAMYCTEIQVVWE